MKNVQCVAQTCRCMSLEEREKRKEWRRSTSGRKDFDLKMVKEKKRKRVTREKARMLTEQQQWFCIINILIINYGWHTCEWGDSRNPSRLTNQRQDRTKRRLKNFETPITIPTPHNKREREREREMGCEIMTFLHRDSLRCKMSKTNSSQLSPCMAYFLLVNLPIWLGIFASPTED